MGAPLQLEPAPHSSSSCPSTTCCRLCEYEFICNSSPGGERHYGRLESGEFSFKKACGTTVPHLDGAFCGVNVTIDDLKVWQAPKIE